MISLAILASHNGSGFDAIYEAIEAKLLDIKIELVISNNPNAKVIEKANARSISSYIINTSTDENPNEKIHNLIKAHQCDYIFLSGYMKKLSPLLTNNFKIINSHPALLPKFGGPGMYGRFVHEAVLSTNESVSGVTIHEVNEFYDEGKIILQKELQINKNETIESLENRIKDLETTAIVEALKLCLK